MSTVGKWAEKRGLPYTSYVDLSSRPEVAQLIIDEAHKINATLPGSIRVARLVLLNKELDADDAEITRTRKVRRAFVAEKYAALIAAFYDGGTEARVTMQITFEDGRKSAMTTTLKIHDVRVSEGRRMAA
jgi:long-chain acyl-CoA synthetase